MKKHQTTLSNEIEQKIIRLFALGISYTDIIREVEGLYAFSVSGDYPQGYLHNKRYRVETPSVQKADENKRRVPE
ncbi:hypothetical protein XNA1_2400004 [Xenorhabdus nematophila str. Anatoliense]|nr:hypothetical protein XNA1_2400004 [Xenorhabdus nematophila str. Anatoliense]